ncbi:hypothetical protein LEP3755_03380 [Leptolyngbya sp. NIES-3755]|nr:hypothetical protein LEP3755_03380 [Leptolyngbya sp. NIES-3755]
MRTFLEKQTFLETGNDSGFTAKSASLQLDTDESNLLLRQLSASISRSSIGYNPSDFAGNTLSTARAIAVSATTTSYQDFVGSVDTNDYYRFTLTDTRNFSLGLTGLTADADVSLLNSTGSFIAGSSLGGTSAESIAQQLTAGTYYIRVYPYSGDTNYTLSVSAAPSSIDFAGNTLSTARVITVGTTTTNYQDFVGSVDTNDYYRFSLSDTRNFSLRLTGLTADADVSLLNSTGSFITGSSLGGTSAESITQQLTAGTYYIRVYPYSGNTNYTLSVSAAPVLPSLSIVATDPTAAEVNSGQAANPGLFTITRTGSTAAALTLSYLVSGSATKGSDYNNITGTTGNTGTITIPVGATSVTIPINVINDALIEASESVVLTLNSGTGYQLGTNSATVTILDNDSPTVPNPTVSTFALTGNNQIDSLLASSRTFWNTSGSGGNITYSFYRNSSGSYYGSEIVTELSETIKTSVRRILSMISSYVNVNFVEVADTANSFGVLRYMFSNLGGGGGYAYAYYPGVGVGGDVHLSSAYESDPVNRFSGAPGNHGYMTLIHETFHAIGLKHPGNYNGSGTGEGPFLPGGEDNTTNTLMSYNFPGPTAITPMAYDIRALQYLYGVRSYNSTNTNYVFNSVNNYTLNGQVFGTTGTSKQSVWDSGGVDTFNFSGLATTDRYRFDLRGGGLMTTQSAFNSTSYTDRSGTGTYSMTGFGTSIAFNTVIENLVNSRSDDFVIANSAANTFSGYTRGVFTGNDIYEGTNSADVLDLSSYGLADLATTVSSGTLNIRLGTSGTIQVRNYFSSAGSMRVRVGSTFYRYSTTGGWQVAPSPALPANHGELVTASGGLTSRRDLPAAPDTPAVIACSCAACAVERRLNQLGNSALSDRIRRAA